MQFHCKIGKIYNGIYKNANGIYKTEYVIYTFRISILHIGIQSYSNANGFYLNEI